MLCGVQWQEQGGLEVPREGGEGSPQLTPAISSLGPLSSYCPAATPLTPPSVAVLFTDLTAATPAAPSPGTSPPLLAVPPPARESRPHFRAAAPARQASSCSQSLCFPGPARPASAERGSTGVPGAYRNFLQASFIWHGGSKAVLRDACGSAPELSELAEVARHGQSAELPHPTPSIVRHCHCVLGETRGDVCLI